MTETLLEFFKAMAHESRLRMIGLLAQREHSVQELAEMLDLKEPTVSHHLKVLRDAGIVGSERRGLWAYYYVNPDSLEELSAWLNA